MDKIKIQKPITGLFVVILILISCQSRNDCGLKCGIGMSLEEKKICVLLDTSLFKKPYARYIDLPELHGHRRDVLSELDVRSESKSDLFNFSFIYNYFKDTSDVYLKMYKMKNSYDYFMGYGPEVRKVNDFFSTYMICDTFYGGYIRYDYNYYFDEFNHRDGWVDVYYLRKETAERSLSVGMKLSDNMFRSGDSLRAIQLIKSLEVLNEGCNKKCLCYPD